MKAWSQAIKINHLANFILTMSHSLLDKAQQAKYILPMKPDTDLLDNSSAQLRQKLMRLRSAIRKHRDASENSRCWHNDLKLYGELPEETPPGRMLGDEKALLQNCQRYIRRQRCAQDHDGVK